MHESPSQTKYMQMQLVLKVTLDRCTDAFGQHTKKIVTYETHQQEKTVITHDAHQQTNHSREVATEDAAEHVCQDAEAA